MRMSRVAGVVSLAVAVAAALAPAATASPRLGTFPPAPATPRPGALPGAAVRRGVVSLINGARVLAGLGVGARDTAAVLPGGRGSSLIGISVAGNSDLIPPQAMPYLGRGLDPSLFDVAALAGRERAGRLPVTLAYRGELPGLPGVTITHTASEAAQGYLTEAGARAFGAALARQFAADHARGSYGQDGMFADGLSVTLAGERTRRAAPRQSFPMHALTVTGTGLAGRPDTGDIVCVINVDNIGRFSDPAESQSVFYHGSARFSVPAGHYMAIATFYSFTGTKLTGFHVVARPQFTVSGRPPPCTWTPAPPPAGCSG